MAETSGLTEPKIPPKTRHSRTIIETNKIPKLTTARAVISFVKQGIFVRLGTSHVTIVQNQVILATYVKSVRVILRNQIIDRDSGLPLGLLEVCTKIHRYL